MKKIKKIISVVERKIIKLWAYINVGKYMKFYSSYLKKIGVNVNGVPKFISPDVYFDGTDYSMITIGDNVTISREVMLLTHDYSLTNAMAAIGKKIDRGEGELFVLDEISIGDNSFIGARVSILPGTKIGKNVIIGACAVVKGNIPDNSIMIGNPAKCVGETQEYAKRKLEENYYRREL